MRWDCVPVEVLEDALSLESLLEAGLRQSGAFIEDARLNRGHAKDAAFSKLFQSQRQKFN